MNKLSVIALSAVALVSVAHANGLTTTISSLYEELLTNTRYAVRLGEDDVKIVDPTDGREIITISQSSATQVTIDGVVAQVPSASASVREEIRYRVSNYNVSAAVGTLTYDESLGLVKIHHHLNPTRVKASIMASVAVLVADAARSEARLLAELQKEIRVAECASDKELCQN